MGEFRIWKSKYWFLPVFCIVILGYAVGLSIWFTAAFFDLFADLHPEARLLVQVFGLGLVGAAVHSTIYFAKDANDVLYSLQECDTRTPHFLEPFGYCLHIISGGCTALALYFAFKVGLVVFSQSDQSMMSQYGAWLLGICGGLGLQRVKSYIIGLVSDLTKKERVADQVDRRNGEAD